MTQATSTHLVEHDIGPGGTFHLRLHDGDVRVRAVEGSVARLVETGGRDLAERFTVEAGPGRLAIRARERLFSLVFARRGVSLEVDVPTRATVVVESTSGDVQVAGLRGPQRYRTASGEIRATGVAGDLTVETVSGTTTIQSDGDVSLEARTVSGDLRASARRFLAATVSTTSGDVDLDGELVTGGAHAINSVSGDATVAPRGGIRVEARTVTGSIVNPAARRADSGPGRTVTVVGDGGATLAFRSISGDLRIAGPATRAPAAAEPPAPPAPPEAEDEVARLDVLRALERGEIDVDEATRRLQSVEERTDG